MRIRQVPLVYVATGIMLSLTTARSAPAGEVTVQNDSFQSGGSAIIVGDFIAGERAAARLTAPCDGNIVAVQIAWVSEPPSGVQSVEDSIIIYDAPTFPAPGSILEILEGPVLTEGALNEFRFIDANNQIPLSVPVTQGQQFLVALQFFNPTDVLNGTPSVIEDVNGCQGGKNVIFAIPGGWMNFCSFGAQGDFVIRAVIDCGAATGACCLPDGTCSQMTSADCAAAGGVYQGDLVDCNSVTCPEPTGACCFPSTGGCLDLTASQCSTANGIFQGAGTDCATIVCFPKGACCLPDGSCDPNMTPEDCTALGGTFQGDGTDCGAVTCPEPTGACCFAGGGCLALTQTDCGIAGGTWQGIGTDCADNNGNGTADACEAAPCPGDLDGDGDVDLDDLTLILQDFGCASGTCPGDVDGDGDADLDDLTLLLQAFGVPCP